MFLGTLGHILLQFGITMHVLGIRMRYRRYTVRRRTNNAISQGPPPVHPNSRILSTLSEGSNSQLVDITHNKGDDTTQPSPTPTVQGDSAQLSAQLKTSLVPLPMHHSETKLISGIPRSVFRLENREQLDSSLDDSAVSQFQRRRMLQQDHFLDMIIGDPDLVYMWPQVVLQAGSLVVASQHVAGFVRSYIEDYKERHPSTDIRRAVYISKVSRVLLPGEKNFKEGIRTLMGHKKVEIYACVIGRLTHRATVDNDEGVDIKQHFVRLPDSDLVDESAIGVLCFRVRKYLEETATSGLPPGHRVYGKARQMFENVSTTLYKPPILPNTKRIGWTCVS